METVRDLITDSAIRSGYTSPDAPLSHEEARVFMSMLQMTLSDFRAKGILEPALQQKRISWPGDAASPDFSSVKFIDETRLSEEEKEMKSGDPHCALVQGRPLRPSSVSISLPGNGNVFQPGIYISPDALFALRGTTRSDYSYPIYWTWQAGKHPELLLLCRHIQPQAVLVNALFDQYASLELDAPLDEWPEGLPMAVAAQLEWKICESQSVGDAQAKKREAFRLLDSYRDSFKKKITIPMDPTMPGTHGGIGNARINDYSNITASYLFGGP